MNAYRFDLALQVIGAPLWMVTIEGPKVACSDDGSCDNIWDKGIPYYDLAQSG
jgi:hypothetical protein